MGAEKKIYEAFLKDNPALKTVPVWEAYEIMLECCQNGGKVLVCGNGGSASDSEHIVGELMKGFKLKRELSDKEMVDFAKLEDGEMLAQKLQKGIPAISLNSHTALMTAIGNDVEYDMIFAQQVYGYGVEGDILIGMTTSGNSTNILNAARTAYAKGMKVIGITGQKESKLSACSTICLQMPATETYRVQEYTLPVYHAICAMIEEKMFGGEVEDDA